MLNPLTDAHLQSINSTLDRIQEARQLLDKCANCGLPTDSIKQDLADKEATLQKIKSEFFPMVH